MELRSRCAKHELNDKPEQPESSKRRKQDSPKKRPQKRENELYKLIPEVLTKIFEKLPLDDRKHCKLVCRHWYDLLTSMNFQKLEKTVCRNIYCTREVVSTLSAYRCPLYRVNFEGVCLTKNSNNFWKQHGLEIRELNFRSCVLDDETILEVIEYCDKLTHLSLYPRFDEATLSFEALDALIERGIVRNNLFNISVCGIDNLVSWLTKLTTVFPRIREINLNLNQQTAGGNVLKQLSQSDIFKEGLVLQTMYVSIDPFFHSTSTYTMLQQLDIGPITDNLRSPHAENFLAFISSQKMLKKIRVIFRTSRDSHCGISLRTKLFHTALDNCANLRSLYIRYNIAMYYRNPEEDLPDAEPPKLTIDVALLKKLVKSKLEFLYISDHELQLVGDFSTCIGLENHTLKYLTLHGDQLQENVCSIVVRIFRGLKHCAVTSSITMTSELPMLKSIAEYQTKLASLCVSFDPHNADETASKLHCLSKLTNLKHLTLTLTSPAEGLQLNFPYLEYLDLRCQESDEPLDERFFNTIATQLPNLKYFTVQHFLSIPKALIENMCRTLKKLQFLRVLLGKMELGTFSHDEVEDLFQSSQSLRLLVVQHHTVILNDHEATYYFYDHCRHKLFCMDYERRRFVTLNFVSDEIDLFQFDARMSVLRHWR